MIEIDFDKRTYTCPFCGCKQAFESSYAVNYARLRNGEENESDITIYHIVCANSDCEEISVIGFNSARNEQYDLIPRNVHKQYPEYIPHQIRNDYAEACSIISLSPKAAVTLFRRCLQGMIHDFWKIKERNLNAEITELKDKVSAMQWKAIDGLRSIGNIGAHMEQDVNLIIDVEPNEAVKLQKLIELLIEKWYIARHDEEAVYNEIADISEQKQNRRKQKIQ